MTSRILRHLLRPSSRKDQAEASESGLSLPVSPERAGSSSCSECSRLEFDKIFADNGSLHYTKNKLDRDQYRRSLEVLLSSEACQLCQFVIDTFTRRGLIPKSAKEDFADAESGLIVVYMPHTLAKGTGAFHIRLEFPDAAPAGTSDRWDKDEFHSDTIILYPENDSFSSSRYAGRVVSPFCQFGLLQSWLPLYSDSWEPEVFDVYALRSLRLIDLELMCVSEVRLPAHYAALSYVWGPAGTTQLRLSQDDVSTWSVPGTLVKYWDRIPITIRDAMKVCGECSIPFLWVDALCFIQDTNDMQQQLDSITEIYGLAFVTIVAAWGCSSWSGLKGVSMPRDFRQQRVQVGCYSLIEGLPSITQEFHTAAWSHRGWTFQEHLFSDRCLLFLENRILYQDLFSWQDESIDFSYFKKQRDVFQHLGRLALFNDFGHDDSYLHEATLGKFFAFVESYFELQLTHADDVLNACLGTMAWFRKRSGYEFIYATPRFCLDTGLNFHVSNQQRRPGFPSWSWLGWRSLDNSDTKSIRFNTYNDNRLRMDGPPTPFTFFTIDAASNRFNPAFVLHETQVQRPLDKVTPVVTPSVAGFPYLTEIEGEKVLIFESWIVDLTDTNYVAKLSAPSQAALGKHQASASGGNPVFVSFALVPISAHTYVREPDKISWVYEFPEMWMVVCLVVKVDDRGVSERIEIEELPFDDWETMKPHRQWVYLI